LIVSLLLLLVVGGAVFMMYRSGLRSASGAPEPLGAPLGDVRAPAPAQPGASDPGAGLTISKDDPNAINQAPVLAPPPEQLTPPSVAPTPAAPPQTALPADATSDSTPALAAPPTAKRDTIVVPPGKKPAATTAAPPTIDDKIAAANLPSAAAGGFLVQIGAFSSQSLADKEWSKAAAVAPGAMAGKGKRVVPVTKDGATLYRTSITGFSSRDQAAALCDKLKSAGGACFVH
jgi:cell division protein FtsN